MTTLISIHNSDGCVGRCDARCYMAKTQECHCICGGKNHGVGKQQAEANTRQYAKQWLETIRELAPDCHCPGVQSEIDDFTRETKDEDNADQVQKVQGQGALGPAPVLDMPGD